MWASTATHLSTSLVPDPEVSTSEIPAQSGCSKKAQMAASKFAADGPTFFFIGSQR